MGGDATNDNRAGSIGAGPQGADASDAAQARREPPTIDLAPNDVSGDTQRRRAGAAAGMRDWARRFAAPVGAAAAAGALAAVVVMLVMPRGAPPPVVAVEPPPTLALVNDLGARLARLESQAGASSAPAAAAVDPEFAARMNVAEQSLQTLREQLGTLRRQVDTLATAVNEVKSVPREPGAAAPEGPSPAALAAITERVAAAERGIDALKSQLARLPTAMTGERELRGAVAAMTLDNAVRSGGGYAAQLAAAKQLAERAEALAPLDAFATNGIPSDAILARTLLDIVPALMPPPAQPTGSWWERMQARAFQLVRVRSVGEAPGSSLDAIVSRIEAAAKRHDLSAALREIAALPAERRAPVESFMAQAKARAQALEASRTYLADALAVLSKSTP